MSEIINKKLTDPSIEINWFEKNHSLDGIRGILALIVCFTHAWAAILAPWLGAFNLLHGFFSISARLAVVSFFVVSGYAICISIQQNLIKYKNFNLYDWSINRVFRIYPALIISFFICVILIQLIESIDFVDVSPYPLAREKFNYDWAVVLKSIYSVGFEGNLTGSLYAGLNGPMWSLAIEMQLYVIVGLLISVLKGTLLSRIFFTIILFYLIKVEVLSLFASSLTKLGYISFTFGTYYQDFDINFWCFQEVIYCFWGEGLCLSR